MKGRLGYDKWYVWQMGRQDFAAERTINGNNETRYLHSHCLACAKIDILAKYGGKIDLRGWHKQGNCGLFLWAMQHTVDQETTA